MERTATFTLNQPEPLNRHFGFEEEITRIRKAGESWYLLPNTGFNVGLQIDQFEKGLQAGIEAGLNTNEILKKEFAKIEQDIQGVKTEYLCEGLLFPIVLSKKEVDGQLRIVAPLYDNKLLVDTVTENERKGAVKNSVKEVESFLLAAHPGSVAVMTSPHGWTGFEGISYQDTQTYIWHVGEKGQVRGFTVRTDMNLSQNRQLLTTLGKDLAPKDSQIDQIIDIVSNPVFIRCNYGQKPWEIEDVVSIVKQVKNSPFAYKEKGFSEIYEQLKNPEKLWTLDETTRRLTDKLKAFYRKKLMQDDYNRQEFEIALGITVLKLAQEIRGKSKTSDNLVLAQQSDRSLFYSDYTSIHPKPGFFLSLDSYKQTLADVQTLPGCAGGGQKSASESAHILTNTLSPRLISSGIFQKNEQEDTSDFECGGTMPDGTKCTYVVKYGSGTRQCPKCGRKAVCA